MEEDIVLEEDGKKDSFGKDIDKKIKDIKGKLDVCEKERKEYLDGWKRAKADSINEKNRLLKEIEANEKRVLAEYMLTNLPILDSLILAMADNKEEGIKNIYEQYKNCISSLGGNIIDKIGDFDPKIHESVGTKEVKDKKEAGKVVEVVRVGCTLGEILVRPASVILGEYKE